MLMRIRRIAAGALALVGLLALVHVATVSAFADGNGGITVTPDPQGRWDPPRVDVGVRSADRTARSRMDGASAPTPPRTRNSTGAADRCRWVPDPGVEAVERRMADPPDGPAPAGARLFARICGGGVLQGWRWLTPGQTGVAAPPSPAVLARRAYRQLVLPAPMIRTSPPVGVPQLVWVPTWLWIDRAGWGIRRATAAVPGLSATAVAVPARVVWSTGDGSTVVCSGAGSPFRPGVDNAYAPSPDCGHTYLRASTSEPGGLFTLTATVWWQVSWSGGGQSGVLPQLASTGRMPLQVVEAPAVNR